MRLIDADMADINDIYCYYGEKCELEDVQEWLHEQPTIEAEPVRHGKWEKVADLCGIEVLKCSVCGVERPRLASKYCCDCGARMEVSR